MIFWDPTYWIIVPAIIFSLIAQIKVSSTFQKYSSVQNKHGINAYEAARKILDASGLYGVSIERTAGNLTDHYDPNANVIRLSDSVYSSTSVAAIGVAAHEVGHAIQHSEGYAPIKIRNILVPVTRFGSFLSMPLVLLGLVFSMQFLISLGIFLFTGIVLFQAVTLPVEYNASSRALKTLDSNLILYKDEVKMAKKVLSAAAMTYLAAMLSSLLSLLRLIALSNRRRH